MAIVTEDFAGEFMAASDLLLLKYVLKYVLKCASRVSVKNLAVILLIKHVMECGSQVSNSLTSRPKMLSLVP